MYCNCCFQGCDVANFENNFTFLIKLFFCLTKESRDKFKYPENEKNLLGEIKSIFHYFWRAFSCQKLSQIWECTSKLNKSSKYRVKLKEVQSNNCLPVIIVEESHKNYETYQICAQNCVTRGSLKITKV